MCVFLCLCFFVLLSISLSHCKWHSVFIKLQHQPLLSHLSRTLSYHGSEKIGGSQHTQL
ncbi:hypothetical protein MANES_09G154250v8 [Manihot esculenta]|uniref:Uncharacterized protein n=1 Tax=Manihot esculenta TaxID=3983 RepID=A0ACB7H626_MANES|nr:hypothetical protein MANES_09G154250v8 [Manihot esculenta]